MSDPIEITGPRQGGSERLHWHPVIASDALQAQPVAVRLLDVPLVVWRDAAGRPQAWAEHCPHRGASLALGQVQDDRLVCGYHGWCFARDGRVASVPALPGHVPPPHHRAQTYDAVDHCGLLWVRLAASDLAPPPFAAEADAALRKLTCGPYDVATSAPRIVDNFLDMAHFGFVHDGLLGAPEHAAVGDYRIETTACGFLATGCSAWQPQATADAEGGSVVDYTYEVNAPYTAILTKAPLGSEAAVRDAIALFICPVDAETSRVWFRLALTDATSSDTALRAFQDTIFAQDQPIVESQRPKRLPIAAPTGPQAHAAPRELHSAADRSGAAYRQFLRQSNVRFGTV